MPFQQQQKADRDPTYRDQRAIEAIQLKLTDLENVIRSYVGTGTEVQEIVGTLRKATGAAINMILKG
jgi:hypothetical protein